MNILTPRTTYAPMHYPQADTYCEMQNSVHWLPNEIPLGADVNDWKLNLNKSEQNVISQILKSFTSVEIFVEDYWAAKVSRWFKHPEIQGMAVTFAAFERIHAKSYARLNEELNMTDFQAFLSEPTAKAKIDRLVEIKGKNKTDIIKSLAVFSAFVEGVSLFSSFAVLMSFQRRNLMKGAGKIVEYSVRDESLHSNAGCWLFKTMIQEFPELWTEELKAELIEAARLTVELEDAFIDKVFEFGDIEGISAKDLKNYIRYRTNGKLNQLGLANNWKNIDKIALDNMTWFDVICSGVIAQDFFAGQESGYAKVGLDFTEVWA